MFIKEEEPSGYTVVKLAREVREAVKRRRVDPPSPTSAFSRAKSSDTTSDTLALEEDGTVAEAGSDSNLVMAPSDSISAYNTLAVGELIADKRYSFNQVTSAANPKP